MKLDPTTTVREITTRSPSAYRVFQAHGVDFCCRSDLPLDRACQRAGATLETILAELEEAHRVENGASTEPNWHEEPIVDLLAHIVDHHHVFARHELIRLEPLLRKVERVHGPRHPEISEIKSVFGALVFDLLPHMQKEEAVLFPYIEELLAAARTGHRPSSAFGSILSPVRAMGAEHEETGLLLHGLRRATRGFRPPADACGSHRALYAGLAALSANLMRHIQLENDVLFPRAVALEKSLLVPSSESA